jgi:hypothetical protein
MENLSLFSHPDVPEVVPSDATSTEPVEHPTFSDRPDTNSPGSSKRSS